jgi:hypothetical protein
MNKDEGLLIHFDEEAVTFTDALILYRVIKVTTIIAI